MINVTKGELKIVSEILSEFVADCDVWAFGSRQKGTNRNYSDLDLAVVGKEKLPTTVMDALREAFMESELPYRVDIIDYHAISPEFRKIVDADHEIIFSGL